MVTIVEEKKFDSRKSKHEINGLRNRVRHCLIIYSLYESERPSIARFEKWRRASSIFQFSHLFLPPRIFDHAALLWLCTLRHSNKPDVTTENPLVWRPIYHRNVDRSSSAMKKKSRKICVRVENVKPKSLLSKLFPSLEYSRRLWFSHIKR